MILDLWSILFLAIAISLDGFSVGVTYGMRKIKMGFYPLLIISGISTLIMYITVNIGANLAELFNPDLAASIGGLFLIIIGAWLLLTNIINKKKEDKISWNDENELLFTLKIKPLGIIIQILNYPAKVDIDHSGTIDITEAFILGLALAFDAIGVGLGAGLVNYSIYILPLTIGIVNISFMLAGYYIGKYLHKNIFSGLHYELVPGILIIFLGIIKII